MNLESLTTGTEKIQAERALAGCHAVIFYHEKSVASNFFVKRGVVRLSDIARFGKLSPFVRNDKWRMQIVMPSISEKSFLRVNRLRLFSLESSGRFAM